MFSKNKARNHPTPEYMRIVTFIVPLILWVHDTTWTSFFKPFYLIHPVSTKIYKAPTRHVPTRQFIFYWTQATIPISGVESSNSQYLSSTEFNTWWDKISFIFYEIIPFPTINISRSGEQDYILSNIYITVHYLVVLRDILPQLNWLSIGKHNHYTVLIQSFMLSFMSITSI